MMGGEAPETCWAAHKGQVINLWNCCILLVDLFELYVSCFRHIFWCIYFNLYLSIILYPPQEAKIIGAPLFAALSANGPANYQLFRHSLSTRNWSQHTHPGRHCCRVESGSTCQKTTQYNEQLIGESSRTFTMSSSSSFCTRDAGVLYSNRSY